MDDKLKPCAHCGGEAEIHFENGFEFRSIFYYVSCKKCGCRTDANTEVENDAVKAWNSRKPSLSVSEIKEIVEEHACYADECIDKIATAIHKKLEGE